MKKVDCIITITSHVKSEKKRKTFIYFNSIPYTANNHLKMFEQKMVVITFCEKVLDNLFNV